ncbi:hypothetical protein EDB83DRAFT_2313746 [Lactarius deliciosus]|nr:hypothetical protein EDB83DRAFT_2313746 [Lactarius deliciosus]
MSNPSKSFLHSDDQQAGQVQKVKKVRQVQYYCKMQPWRRDVMGVYEPWRCSGGWRLQSLEHRVRHRGSGLAVAVLDAVLRCGVSCTVSWRHGDGVGGFARWVGCGVMAKWHGWGGDERKKKNNKNQKTHSKRGFRAARYRWWRSWMGGDRGHELTCNGEAAVTQVEQEAEAELVVVLRVTTAWWGGNLEFARWGGSGGELVWVKQKTVAG